MLPFSRHHVPVRPRQAAAAPARGLASTQAFRSTRASSPDTAAACCFPEKEAAAETTASLSCALAGYDYVGDDCVGVDLGKRPRVIAHSLFGSTNVAPHHLSRFPALASHAIAGVTPDEDKDLVLLGLLLPRPLARLATVRAIVIVNDSGAGDARTRLVPATRADALRTLAPSTLLFFPGSAAGQMAFRRAGRRTPLLSAGNESASGRDSCLP